MVKGSTARLATFIAAAALLAAVVPARAAAAGPTRNAAARVKIVKPLVVTWLQDLDLGTILMNPGAWSGATVSLTRTGAFSCAAPNLTCSGAVQVARYNVVGTNNQTVTITAPNVTLVNQADPSATLTMVVDNPGSLTLPNSGQPGVAFALGGAITLDSATGPGSYAGTFNVTVDY